MPTPLSDLQLYVWKRLGIRKYMVGRQEIYDLVEVTAANWSSEYLLNARNENEMAVVIDGMLADIKRSHQMLGQYDDSQQEYGFLWAILLQALVGAIVQIILKWWLESRENRDTMTGIKAGLVG